MNPFSALSLNLDESFSLVQEYQQHHPNQNLADRDTDRDVASRDSATY